MEKVNLHITPSTFEYPSRILKETSSLSKAGLFTQIYVVAIAKATLPEIEVLDSLRTVWRVNLLTGQWHIPILGKVIGYLEWTVRIVCYFWKIRIDTVNCHSVACLPLCMLLKVLFSAKVIYDAHELETETVAKHGLKKLAAKCIEQLFINFVDGTIVVNEAIAKWYRKRYQIDNVYVVQNVPVRSEFTLTSKNHFRKTFSIPDSHIIFLYQGLMIEGRGIQILLDVFTELWRCGHQNLHIVFMGHGPWVDLVMKCEQHCRNIHYHYAVEPNRVLEYTQSADVGICLIENVCLSYYLSLPNKLFEYILSGLPVIGSQFPEIINVLNAAGNGWVVQPSFERLINIVQNITQDDIAKKRSASLAYRECIGWQEEEANLWAAFQNTLGKSDRKLE